MTKTSKQTKKKAFKQNFFLLLPTSTSTDHTAIELSRLGTLTGAIYLKSPSLCCNGCQRSALGIPNLARKMLKINAHYQIHSRWLS